MVTKFHFIKYFIGSMRFLRCLVSIFRSWSRTWKDRMAKRCHDQCLQTMKETKIDGGNDGQFMSMDWKLDGKVWKQVARTYNATGIHAMWVDGSCLFTASGWYDWRCYWQIMRGLVNLQILLSFWHQCFLTSGKTDFTLSLFVFMVPTRIFNSPHSRGSWTFYDMSGTVCF